MFRPFLAILFASFAFAHQQPTTLILLDVRSGGVEMNLQVPLNELELAFGHDVNEHPEAMAKWGPPLAQYLTQHIRPATWAGEAWSVQVRDMKAGKAQQTQSGPFRDVIVDLFLTPPDGSDVRNFILNYDVIMHQVVTHTALVSLRSDWAAGQVESAQAGTILVNTGTGRVDPMAIRLGEGSWWIGFRAMLSLGAQHIREGTDHLLFLLVLLLPSTLLIRGREWGGFGGTHYSVVRLIRIVTAFTLGHSATLLAGALHWLQIPQQPVEVLIACSILITAIHAIRPVFPGREAQVAAGFGLVHGLAFAGVLADLKLTGAPLALSLLGCNLGIEMMQLFVLACTIPWLILLNVTPAHRWVRLGGAIFAGIAASGWIVNRVSGESNGIERSMETVTRFAPLGILLLAAIAVPAYLYTMFLLPANRLNESEQIP